MLINMQGNTPMSSVTIRPAFKILVSEDNEMVGVEKFSFQELYLQLQFSSFQQKIACFYVHLFFLH